MRIVVNDIAASTGGAMTVLRDFYTCVCENDHENEWIFLLNKRYFEETQNVKIVALPQVKKSGLRKLWFDFVSGRRFIERLRPDVVFSLQNIITFGLKMPQVVYIHQSIPFQSVKKFSFWRSSERKLAVIQYLIGAIIKYSAKKSDCVIVQTKWMKEAVCRLCGIPEDKVLVSLPAVKTDRHVQMDACFEKTMFFYPTANAVYKNNGCIQEASQLLEKRGIDHTITMTLPKEKSGGRIICVGRLPYEQVIEHYRKSTLVFPSYMETFGYPLAEARQAGTIVLASDTPFSREVLDGYENAHFFDPFKPGELSELMEQVAVGKLVKKEDKAAETASAGGWEEVVRWVLEMKNL